MTTKINILYCHATGRAHIQTAKPILDTLGQDTYERTSRVVEFSADILKANIMKWLVMGHDVTIKSV
jgi:hypothetical protein